MGRQLPLFVASFGLLGVMQYVWRAYSYLDCLSQYMQGDNIPFTPLYLANAIVAQRCSM